MANNGQKRSVPTPTAPPPIPPRRQSQHRSPASASPTPFPNHFIDPLLSSHLDVVDSACISPSSFFRRYIASRRPCIISPPSPLWPCWQWSNAQLCSEAGQCSVQAEQRTTDSGGFGHGNKVRMKFEQFVRRIASGDTSLYITTQYDSDGGEGEAEDEEEREREKRGEEPSPSASSAAALSLRYLLAPPLTHLLGDFPLHPALFASLIPNQFNLWFGHAPSRTSSRLHHDFHCNLYMLLRGRKHITLVSPAHAHRMRLAGRVREVKRNGLICYDGDGMYEDASTDTERRQERKVQVEDSIAALERDIQAMEERAGSRAAQQARRDELQAAEAELDELLDAELDEEGADGRDEEDDGGQWQDEDSDQADNGAVEDDEGVGAAELAKWKRWSKQSNKAAQSSSAQKRDISSDHSERTTDQPPNFSALSAATLPADVPRVVVQLTAPAMLYMPCGWFHEVESESEQVDTSSQDGQLGHCALNVWFVPPDQLDNESQPYSQQQLWQRRWSRQKQQLDELTAARMAQRQQAQSQTTKRTTHSGGVFGRRGWRQQ